MANAKKPREMTRAELLDEVERHRRRVSSEAGHTGGDPGGRALAERLRELESSLASYEKMSALGPLVGAIAHGFNNHLTVISTHAELLAEAALPSGTSAHLEQIARSAERARELVQQLATFSRSEPLRVEVVDAGEVLRDMAPALHTIVGEQAKLHLTVGETPPLLRIDPAHLERIVINLVTNARDALPEGGNIWVRLDEAAAIGQAAAVDDEPMLELSVRDDGVGMNEETRRRAFEPFFTTRPHGGATGIGLATVQALTRRHDGTASIDSSAGAGTTVRLCFPRAKAHGSGSRRVDGSPAQAHLSSKILVVEDQPIIRRLVRRLLERDGHHVATASSAEEALTIAEGDEFDLLVTDVMMPGASGLELVEQLRRRRPGLPVLLTSGTDDERELDERTAFVRKPFKVEQLRELVERLLEQARATRAG